MIINKKQIAGCGKTSGFTLIEIIVVLTVLSVLSAVYASRFMGSNVELIAGIEALKTQLRHAQSRAMSTSGIWYVQFSPGGAPENYSLYEYVDGSADEIKVFPGEDDSTVALTDGITIGVSSGQVVSFDRLGRPFTDSGGTASRTTVWTIATSSVGNVEIKPETGYIP